MATYEEQLRKWVLKRYPDLDPEIVATVSVTPETFYGGYCNTCKYEEEGYKVRAYNSDGREVFTDKSGTYTLTDILRQIIEAE